MALQDLSPEALRELLREVFSAPEYQWDRRDPLEVVRRSFRNGADWIAGLQDAHPVLYYVVIGALVGVLAAILLHFGVLIWQSLRPRLETEHASSVPTDQLHGYEWHVRAYRRALETGRCAEALAHRFAALVAYLDGVRAVRAHPAKTPAEYLREADLDGDRRERLADVVRTLYAHLFGGVSCSAGEVARFDAVASELEA